MSTPTAKPAKPKKDRDRDKERLLSQPPSNERLKTVVRRLPPNLPEEIFWQSVQPWVTEETITWKAFYPGKLRKRMNKENVPSRAYIAFKTEEQLAQFGREYDGHLYRDKAGNESYAVVEFAPYQKVPPEKKKVDARSGTLDKDEDYISFLESLNAEPSGAETVSLESLTNRAPSPPKTTPLLEALKAEKAAQKEKESALRQIAQQKKKNAAAAAAQTASTSGAPLSKKAAKKAAAAAAAAASVAPKPGAAGPSKPAGPASAAQPANINAAPPRPPKPSKAPRQPARVPGPPAVPTDVSVASALNTGPGGTAEPPAAAARRTRPVIGLASRQFEAALSGAGVASAAGSVAGPGAEQRKSRRERERERAAAAAAAAGSEEGAPAGSAGPSGNAPPPRKEKPPRRKDSVSGGVTVSTAGGSGAEVRVPSILQRAADPTTVPAVAPVIVHRIDGDVMVQPQAGVIPVNFAAANANVGPPRGGGRGGRGGRGGGGRARGGIVGGGVPVSRGGG
ncbi:Smg-4/UPF3 family-domain-containing protein [Mycena haematopus]|nr:Smg-4/UPF3 family-domain-containing protein [Mycena haematopus]